MAQPNKFTILLLYDKVAAALPVVQSLKEKEMDVHVVVGATDLIQHISSRHIDVVGLSVNHASTPSMLQVLRDKTKIQVLIFGEDKHPNTARKIEECEADMKISGVVTAYNVWMKLGHLVKVRLKEIEGSGQIIRSDGKKPLERDKNTQIIVKGSKAKTPEEQQAAAQREKMRFGQNSKVKVEEEVASEDPDVIALENQEDPIGQVQRKPGVNFKRKPFGERATVDSQDVTIVHQQRDDKPKSKLFKGPPKSPLMEAKQGEVTTQEQPIIDPGKVFKKKKDDNQGRVFKGESSTGPLGKTKHKPEAQLDEEIGAIEQMFNEDAKGKWPAPPPAPVEEPQEAGSVEVAEEKEKAPSKVIAKADKKATAGKVKKLKKKEDIGSVEVIDEESSAAERHVEPEEEKPVGVVIDFQKYKGEREARKKTKKPVDKMETLRFRKQFRDAVGTAGAESFKTHAMENFNATVSKITVVPVDTEQEKGFLMFCTESNEHMGRDEIQRFKSDLGKAMNGLSESDLGLGEPHHIETLEVDLQAWASQHSLFHYIYEDTVNGQKVAVCFLRREHVHPDLQKINEINMYQVDLHNLPPMTPVTFKAFIYFAKNQKLILYLKEGGKLTPKQIQRLYKKGFKSLYIPVEHKEDFCSFFVTLSVNQDFVSKKKSKLA